MAEEIQEIREMLNALKDEDTKAQHSVSKARLSPYLWLGLASGMFTLSLIAFVVVK